MLSQSYCPSIAAGVYIANQVDSGMAGYLPPGATHKGDSADAANLVTKITLNGGADWSLLDPPKEVRCFLVICSFSDAATFLWSTHTEDSSWCQISGTKGFRSSKLC